MSKFITVFDSLLQREVKINTTRINFVTATEDGSEIYFDTGSVVADMDINVLMAQIVEGSNE